MSVSIIHSVTHNTLEVSDLYVVGTAGRSDGQ